MSGAGKAVFLSYASQDAEAARRLCEALRAAGVEVWFDQNELVGGDAWDAKIRGQIASCALFVPVISAGTQARREGYFRLEWKLAVQRMHMIADGTPFLVPVVIDDLRDGEALVPAEFKTVQWTRLRGGETPPAFCARVQRLLGDATEPDVSRASEAPAGLRRRSRQPLLWSGVAAACVLGVAAVWLVRDRSGPASVPAPATIPAVPASSEASRLTARARQLRALNGLTRERLGAADDLLKQAGRLDPTDPDVLAAAAQVDALMVFRSWDRPDERRQSAAQRASRALALAPESFEARRAQAMVAAFALRTPESLAEAESIYRGLLRERADDDNLREELGMVLLTGRNYEAAAELFSQAGRPLLAGNAYYLAGRFPEARRIAAEVLAGGRNPGALVLKANVDLFGFNDLDAAQATIAQLTPSELREDDAAAVVLRVAVLSRSAAGLLKLLEQFPHPFVSILGVSYPRQYWTGLAREWRQQPEAARIEWRGALQSLEERLQANPGDFDAISWMAMLHACLGDQAATERALRLYREYRDLSGGGWDFNYCIPLLRLGGHSDEVIDRLEKSMRRPSSGRINYIIYAWARYSPELDPLRGNPRFEKLLREFRPRDAKPFDEPPAPAAKS